MNARGIKSKTNKILANILANDYSIISLTETWLKDHNILNSEFIDSRYEVYRRDRLSSTKKDGGGVLIAIDTSIASKRMLDWETEVEDLWVPTA
jgi:hypothetical protein